MENQLFNNGLDVLSASSLAGFGVPQGDLVTAVTGRSGASQSIGRGAIGPADVASPVASEQVSIGALANDQPWVPGAPGAGQRWIDDPIDPGFDYPGRVRQVRMQDILKPVVQDPSITKALERPPNVPVAKETDSPVPGSQGPKDLIKFDGRYAIGSGVDGKVTIAPGTNVGVTFGASAPSDPDIMVGGVRWSELLKTDKPDDPANRAKVAELAKSGGVRYPTGFPAQDQIVGIADFDRDGQRDFLLRNQTTGEMQIWYMSGENKIGEAPITGGGIPGSSFVIEGVGDFNGDNSPDIIWRELGGGGSLAVWYLNNNQLLSGVFYPNFTAPSHMRVDAVADFDNDGKTDLLWRDYVNGVNTVWKMNGFNYVSHFNLAPSSPVSTSFSIAGVGDSNGDGIQDIFWRNNTTNQTAYWQMNAGYQSIASVQGQTGGGAAFFTNAGLGSIEQIGDVNADGRPDIIWKEFGGSHAAWVLGAGSPSAGTAPTLLSPAGGSNTRLVPFNNTTANNKFVNGTNSFHQEFGYGMVDVAAAIALLRNQAPPMERVDDFAFNTQSNSRQNEILNLPEVWNQGYTGQGVTVAVIDSGVMLNHPDLNDNIWANLNEVPGDGIDNDGNGFIDDRVGWDFFNNDALPLPSNDPGANHGTAVAGMIAAEAAINLNQSITGGAYNSKIMALRVGNGGNIPDPLATQAIIYAANMGAKVINLSFAGLDLPNNSFQINLENAINYAVSKGAVVVASAGNDGVGTIDSVFPAIKAGTPGVIAVGATSAGAGTSSFNGASQVGSFSTGAGSNIRNYVMAPGQAINTTSRDISGNASYTTTFGTSYSAPLVAAAIATIRQAVPWATPAQITNALTQTADPSDIYL